MNATPNNKVIPIYAYHNIEGQHILEVSCVDYDAFKSLPNGLDFQGRTYVKTGWNSDTGRACFKTGVPFARVVC